MRINNQLLRSRACGPLHSLEYLDLSDLNLERIERLQCCKKIQTLSFRGNHVDYVSNLDHCLQLWKLDLSNNQIKILEGLSKFVAIGTLILSNNQISWTDLNKIRHMHILDLCLHGNKNIEKDPYYRIHVIDSLPYVWMLDGRLITSAERLQVEHFFQESALTDHPVRHKLSRVPFRPTSRKNIQVNGIFGEKTTHLMRRFPVNGTLNRDLDQRRLLYLAYNIENDLKLQLKHKSSVKSLSLFKRPFLENLIKARETDRERCNMLLLLLVASLEFAMPSQLMKAAIESTQLGDLGGVHVFDLFILPREARCSVISLLLSGVKLDKDMGEEGGLYDKLYLCLYYCVSELLRLCHSSTSKQDGTKSQNPTKKPLSTVSRDSRCLIAAEVVQLFCVVPQFFHYLNKDVGVMNMILTATADDELSDKLYLITQKTINMMGKQNEMFEEAAEIILRSIQNHALHVLNKTTISSTESSYVLNTWKKAIPRRPASSAMVQSEYHTTGRSSPDKSGSKLVRVNSSKIATQMQAKLGDKILLGPQTLGRIISIPESDIVLVQMDVIPSETGAMISNTKNADEHYTYINLDQVYWDNLRGYWRPKGTVGDRITIQSVDESEMNLLSQMDKFAEKSMNYSEFFAGTPTKSTKGVTGVIHTDIEYDKNKSKASPRSVSTNLKEKYNLSLTPGYSPNQKQETARPSTCKPDMRHPNNDFPQRPHTAHRVETYDPDMVSGGNVFIEGLGLSRPSSASVGKAVFLMDDRAGTETIVSRRSSLDSTVESELRLCASQSRASTRPGTAASRKSSTTLNAQTRTEETPDCPIQIPRVTEDPESQNATPASSGRQGRKSPHDLLELLADIPATDYPHSSDHVESGSKGDGCIMCAQEAHERAMKLQAELQNGSEVSQLEPPTPPASTVDYAASHASYRSSSGKKSPAPMLKTSRTTIGSIGTVEGHKIIVARSENNYDSPYQKQCTEAWKHGKSIPSTPAGSEYGPPTSRPVSSPTNKSKTGGQPGTIRVKRGDTWLAQGRDVYWESLNNRPKTPTSQGWKEGMSPRPKSAAALRALRRAKTPNIVTPSSIAFEHASAANRGFAGSEVTPATPEPSAVSSPVPLRRLGSTEHAVDCSKVYKHVSDFRWDY